MDDNEELIEPVRRDPVCVEAWPECFSFGYDPRCCRFPKSCSADIVDPLPDEPATKDGV